MSKIKLKLKTNEYISDDELDMMEIEKLVKQYKNITDNIVDLILVGDIHKTSKLKKQKNDIFKSIENLS